MDTPKAVGLKDVAVYDAFLQLEPEQVDIAALVAEGKKKLERKRRGERGGDNKCLVSHNQLAAILDAGGRKDWIFDQKVSGGGIVRDVVFEGVTFTHVCGKVGIVLTRDCKKARKLFDSV